ncbi:hypothetical protein [Arthrobacter oryzae]|uniref:hypothetical protein n=1 Tax=Arthrobacter oryzae TaxID=409290 RepID=UPI000EB1EE50|nr:hypothetical protein [Arthrobacter oryzae]
MKNAVSLELKNLDPTAKIHRTDYFNHTFAPDFVMSWPDQIDRHVYLRFTYDLGSVADDVSLIDRRNALIFGLTRPEDDRAGLDSIAVAASAHDAMFTDADALENLIDRKKTSATVNMLNNALAQGGKGILLGEQANDLARTIENEFSGAEQIEIAPTSNAVLAIRANLDTPQAWRMNRVLQAVWEGSSGALEAFPGERDLSGKLNSDALQYLVSYMETEDLGFWRRVGRTLRISQIETLKKDGEARNVDRLISANLDVIRARAYAVFQDPLGVEKSTTADHQNFRWSVRNEQLRLSGPRFYATIGETKSELRHESAEGRPGITVPTFVERSSETKLNEVTIRSDRDVVIARNEDGALDKNRLLGLSSQLGPGAEILEATVQSGTGRVTADFRTYTGTGQTRSNVLLADLVLSSLPLLQDFSEEDKASLRDFLTYTVHDEAQRSLPGFEDDSYPNDE